MIPQPTDRYDAIGRVIYDNGLAWGWLQPLHMHHYYSIQMSEFTNNRNPSPRPKSEAAMMAFAEIGKDGPPVGWERWLERKQPKGAGGRLDWSRESDHKCISCGSATHHPDGPLCSRCEAS